MFHLFTSLAAYKDCLLRLLCHVMVKQLIGKDILEHTYSSGHLFVYKSLIPQVILASFTNCMIVLDAN